MTFKNLSSSHNNNVDQKVVTPTPNPYEKDVVPNDENSTEEKIPLTNDQRYFENIISPGGTNVLLLGSEPTGFNFDTIMILNIDKTGKCINTVSLPRDIYIDYTDDVKDALNKAKPNYLKEKGIYKINAAPSIGEAIDYKKGSGRFDKPYVDFLADLIEEVFSVQINDYAYVKVNGFRKIVDYFGGVTVYVPVLMNYSDPSQDFEVYIEKGTKHLDGKDAEGYVRFRQGYDENGAFHNYGDIFRKENQNRFIKAMISQHVTLKNLGKLSKVADIISSNVITSVKGWDSIVDYGAMAEDAVLDQYKLNNLQLEFTEKTIKGSSYVVLKTEK